MAPVPTLVDRGNTNI
jgi:hypothetical protein